MAVADIQRAEIIAHTCVRNDLLSIIQEDGLIQIERTELLESDFRPLAEDESALDHTLSRLRNAVNFLSHWDGSGMRERMRARKPEIKAAERKSLLDMEYEPVLDRIEDLQNCKSEYLGHIRFLEREIEFLEPFRPLTLPVQKVGSTKSTDMILGVLPASSMEKLQEKAAEDPFMYHEISRDKRSVHLILIFLKNDKAAMEEMLREMDFRPLYFTDPVVERSEKKDRVQDVLKRLEKEIEETCEKIKEVESAARSLYLHKDALMGIHDVLLCERRKLISSKLLCQSDRIFCLTGWVCRKDIPRLKERISSVSGLVEMYFRSPNPDEEPPVVLENPKAFKPFEIITRLYGLPKTGAIDPTILLAPFFFIFVGLTVSEGGYGLLVALLGGLYIWKARPRGEMRQFLVLLVILSVATVILGTLVGGWFGFPIRPLLVLDPLQDPVSFLILALALGFIQVWFGTLVNMIVKIKTGEVVKGIFVQGGWLLLLPSLAAFGYLKNPIFGWLALAGAAGIVFFASPSRNPLARFFGGLYSLYDISRYLADILSYSRLLALGLATSVIAMVVNTLCETALGIPWVGWLIAALIFIGGHLFNLGISYLGGFVHSMRLQFVEFFSKFFESGGKPFKPFALESKYVDFIE